MGLDQSTAGLEEDKAAFNKRKTQMDAIGQEDLGKYRDFRDTGKVTDAQQAMLDKHSAVQKTKMRQAYGDAGLSDSTMSKQAEGSIDMDTLITKGNMNLQDMQLFFSNAMTEIGVADAAQANLAQLHATERAEDNQANQAMMGAMMSIFNPGASYMGGSGSLGKGSGTNEGAYKTYQANDAKAQSQGYSSYVSDASGSSGGGISAPQGYYDNAISGSGGGESASFTSFFA